MTEILFILTTIYVAYVFYGSVNKTKPESPVHPIPKAAPAKPVEPSPVVVQKVENVTKDEPPAHAEIQTVAETPVIEKILETPAAQTPEQIIVDREVPTETDDAATETEDDSASDVAANRITHLRNPLTGEISKANVSYLFAKRWIKEALVSEGLLEKIYVNTELNPELNAKIKQALATLKTLPQYQV